MDRRLREMARKQAVELVSAEEIINERARAGVCTLCARSYEDVCPCIGAYIYLDENKLFRLRRNKRSTLPCAVITGVAERKLSLLVFNSSAFDKAPGETMLNGASREKDIKFEDIVDLEVAVLGGVDIGETEKRLLSDYITALEQSGDLYTASRD